ncbi:MAG: DNA-deoxyinosine glycosylase [Oscillospiraceae bacterium]
MKDSTFVEHEFPPVYNRHSRMLILGTIPSPKSRERGFYYMHPQNRFWKTLCAVLGEDIPDSVEGRRQLCLRHKIALWDVLASCEISGAEDSSIKSAVPNDLTRVFSCADIRAVFTTGKKAQALYERFFPEFPRAVCLPSTSPANRRVSDSELLEQYRVIAQYLTP